MPKIIPINKVEDASNKVTELSYDATHEQYPSAKAVYDAISDVTLSVEESLASNQDTINNVKGQIGRLTAKRFGHQDHHKVVIALCRCSEKDTHTSTSSVGNLILCRPNGLYSPANINISIIDSTIDNFKVRASLYGTVPTGHGMTIKPCTFTYNGIVHGGVEIYSSNAEPDYIDFIGICNNIDPFKVEYCKCNANHETSEVLNEEVYNSINFSNVVYENVWKVNSEFTTY